jgi:3-oxoacyl-[acyl-carrier-protein] synthase II
MRNVVITGLGMATPIGRSLAEARATFERGTPVVRAIKRPGGGKDRVAAIVDEDLNEGLPLALQRMLDRFSLLALRASDRAMADAGLRPGSFDEERTGCFLGNGAGPTITMYEAHHSLIMRDTLSAMGLLKSLPNAAASHVSMRHQLRGECLNISTACSSASHAIGQAVRAIRHGFLDTVLTGGTESTTGESHMRAWEAIRVMANPDPLRPETACRPFAKNRTGIVMGEGAVLYVLEAEEHAKARGARIYATIAGYGTSADATHITAPDVRGQSIAIRAALADAGMTVGDIGYINAHGTATPAGDVVETQSIREVFGARADAVPISSTKSIHGHLLGASGAIEMVAALVALLDGVIAPTANLDEPDPQCDLDYVPNRPRTGVKLDAVMSNTFAFGGANVSLILRR